MAWSFYYDDFCVVFKFFFLKKREYYTITKEKEDRYISNDCWTLTPLDLIISVLLIKQLSWSIYKFPSNKSVVILCSIDYN